MAGQSEQGKARSWKRCSGSVSTEALAAQETVPFTGDLSLQTARSHQIRSATQSCPTLCDPKDCSPPGSSVHGILQARILEWVTISDPGIEPMSLALQADSLLLSHWGLLSVNQQILLDISPHFWREVNQSRARVGLGGAGGSLLL